jgi:regulator of replication initiation timing
LEQQMVALMQENARLRLENESLRAQLDDLQQMFAAEPTPHLTATSQVPPFPDEKPPL